MNPAAATKPALYVPDMNHKFKPRAANINVTATPEGKYMLKAEGLLSDVVDEEAESHIDVALSAETDITSSVDNKVDFTYTTRLGIQYAYDNVTEMSPSLGQKGVIIEWRKNIGVEPKKKSSIGRPSRLMVDYAAVGFPYSRFLWIKSRLAELEPRIDLVTSEKETMVVDPHTGKQYMFMNATITESARAMVRYSKTDEPMELEKFMIRIGKSIIGTAIFDAHLKRKRDANKHMTNEYLLSLTLKGFTCTGSTDVRTPPLDSTVGSFELAGDEEFDSSIISAVTNAVNGININKGSPNLRISKPGAASFSSVSSMRRGVNPSSNFSSSSSSSSSSLPAVHDPVNASNAPADTTESESSTESS